MKVATGSVVAALLAVLLLASALGTAGAEEVPRITFSKSFPGSQPAFFLITVERTGVSSYNESQDPDNAEKLQLEPSAASEIFQMADRLDRFSKPLESGLKVANMGLKTFRFEDGAVKHEVKFNYSQDPDAQALLDWFERISSTEQHYIDLDRAVHFDKLGVNQSLLLLQVTWEHKRLIAPQQFLPLLDRVIKNESFLHMARERAATLADAFRNIKSAQVQTP